MNEQPTDYSSIDAFHVSRRRKPNFTDQEVLYIVDQYEMNKEYLHSREASKSVIAQKQAIWKKITDNLNGKYPQVERTVEDVRRKWKKLQSEAKREIATYRSTNLTGSTPTISNKQLNLYNRILSMCRPPIPTSAHYTQAAVAVAAAAIHHQHALQLQSNMSNNENSNNHEIIFNEQSPDKIDSPNSDLANGVNGPMDSPGDETASLIGNDNNLASPATNPYGSPFILPHNIISTSTMASNGQISKRTLEKQRKYLKVSKNFPLNNSTKSYGQQQQNALRLESLIKRKRTLELMSQRIAYDKERLLIERKSLDIKLAVNETENERLLIDRRRIEYSIQKFQADTTLVTNETNNNSSDQEDHDDNNSLDDMSDMND